MRGLPLAGEGRGEGRPCEVAARSVRDHRKPPRDLGARRDRQCARLGIDKAAVETRIQERTAARAAKDFARADEIRKALREQRIELMDGPSGTTWRVV